jgi:UPF0271 protein
MSVRRIDINCDLGESAERFRDGTDIALMGLASSVNIACGYHGGDRDLMDALVREAVPRGVGIGAHPGLPDRAGFGRTPMRLSPMAIAQIVADQVGALAEIAGRQGARLQHVKPHGALYWMAENDDAMSAAIASAVAGIDTGLILVGFAGGRLVRVAADAGMRVAHEAFADRTYRPDGTLTPRTEGNALVDDPAESSRRMVRLVTEQRLSATDGSELTIRADTIGIHGDGRAALGHARHLCAALTENGVAIERLGAD